MDDIYDDERIKTLLDDINDLDNFICIAGKQCDRFNKISFINKQYGYVCDIVAGSSCVYYGPVKSMDKENIRNFYHIWNNLVAEHEIDLDLVYVNQGSHK